MNRSLHFELGFVFFEQFISRWPQRSQVTRSLHFELGWPFFTLRHVNSLSASNQAQIWKRL